MIWGHIQSPLTQTQRAFDTHGDCGGVTACAMVLCSLFLCFFIAFLLVCVCACSLCTCVDRAVLFNKSFPRLPNNLGVFMRAYYFGI